MQPRINKIRVGSEFPLTSGETLRVKLPAGGEIRIKVGPEVPTIGKGKGSKEFYASSKFHIVPTNKESISFVGNERRLGRI